MYTLLGMESTRKLHIDLIDQTKFQLDNSLVLLYQPGNIDLSDKVFPQKLKTDQELSTINQLDKASKR